MPFASKSAHEIVGDEPESAGGVGRGLAPFDLLGAAVAECTAMTARWFAAHRQWPLDHVEVVVDYVKKQPAGASDPIDAFSKTIFLRVPHPDEEQRDRLLDVASRCRSSACWRDHR